MCGRVASFISNNFETAEWTLDAILSKVEKQTYRKKPIKCGIIVKSWSDDYRYVCIMYRLLTKWVTKENSWWCGYLLFEIIVFWLCEKVGCTLVAQYCPIINDFRQQKYFLNYTYINGQKRCLVD